MNRATRPLVAIVVAALLMLVACSSDQGGTASDSTSVAPAAGPASAAPARPQAPAVPSGGVLPLVPGVYVMAGTDCSAPANAGLRFYDGVGISGSATHDCRTDVVSRDGGAYTVEQSCIDAPAGPGPRTRESQTVTVHDPHTFTLATTDEQARFTRCDDASVPDYLRERAGL